MAVWLKCRFQLIPCDAPQSTESTKPVKVNNACTAAACLKEIMKKILEWNCNATERSLPIHFAVSGWGGPGAAAVLISHEKTDWKYCSWRKMVHQDQQLEIPELRCGPSSSWWTNERGGGGGTPSLRAVPGWTTWTKMATSHFLLGMAPGGGPSDLHLSQGNHEPFYYVCRHWATLLVPPPGPICRGWHSWVIRPLTTELLGSLGLANPSLKEKDPAQRRVKKCHDIKMLIE